MGRESWDEHFLHLAAEVAKRSTCIRRQVGCLLVRDKRILATGYNGAPSGTAHCTEVGCLRQKMKIPSGQRHELCRGVHAEQNAIIQAAISGTSIKGAEAFCTTYPCAMCAKMLINCGITTIHVRTGYDDDVSREMLAEAGVNVRWWGSIS